MLYRLVAIAVLATFLAIAYASIKSHYYAFDKPDRNKFVKWIMLMYAGAAVLTGALMIMLLLLLEGVL